MPDENGPTRSTHHEAAPEVRERIEASFARQGLMQHLGAQLVHVGPGRVGIALPARPEITQQHGYIHAGATSAIADSAGGYAALTMSPADAEVLTVEYKINLLAPAVGERLEAVGTVLRSGRTITVCRLDVYAQRDGERSLVAAGQHPHPGRRVAVPGLGFGGVVGLSPTRRALDLPQPCRDGLVVAACGGPLGLAVGEVAAGHLLEIGCGRQVDRGGGTLAGDFMNGRRNGTSTRCTPAGSSAPKAVLTTPGCSALAVTDAARQPPGELVGEQDVGELGLAVSACAGVGRARPAGRRSRSARGCARWRRP